MGLNLNLQEHPSKRQSPNLSSIIVNKPQQGLSPLIFEKNECKKCFSRFFNPNKNLKKSQNTLQPTFHPKIINGVMVSCALFDLFSRVRQLKNEGQIDTNLDQFRQLNSAKTFKHRQDSYTPSRQLKTTNTVPYCKGNCRRLQTVKTILDVFVLVCSVRYI